MSSNTLKGKNILITGVNGFVGSHLFDRLSKMGANVFGLSLKGFGKAIFKVNVLNYSDLGKIIKEKNIQICYHLAGESLVESGQSNPLKTFRVNIDGTLNILENARKNNLERVVIASTSHVYGKNEVPYYESYPSKPTRPYETSKACTDLIAQSYADSYTLPVLIPRFVNIYGPGDLNFTRLIPKTMKQIITENKVSLWGGGAVRDFLYIDDAIDAYVDLALLDISKIEDNRIINFGGGNTISVKEIVDDIVNISKKEVKIVKETQLREDEIKEQYVSFKKAKRLLAWEPRIPLAEGLLKTYKWYSSYFSKYEK